MMKVSRGSKGFTLIELLIVVAIIGILAAVAIPAYTGYTAKARLSEVVNELGAIKTAESTAFQSSNAWTACDEFTAGSECSTALGVSIPKNYLTGLTVTAATGAISATIANISTAVNGKNLTLTPSADGTNWTWSSTDGLPTTYIPANPTVAAPAAPAAG